MLPPEKFIKGLQLSELFFHQAVQPLLSKEFPSLVYSAGRLDYGSDVLGFDTPQSMDHGWGPKVTLFLGEEEPQNLGGEIIRLMGEELPLEVLGFPTHFAANEDGTDRLETALKRPIQHGVSTTTPSGFFKRYLGFDPSVPLRDSDWLLIPRQRLRTVSSGKVFHDGLNRLEAVRQTLSWYPRDVWIYLLACQWQKISQEEPFVARCGDVGDELGSKVIVARMVEELMGLCFLMERQFAPYSKWYGSAFARLSCAAELTPVFKSVFKGETWKAREEALSTAYRIVLKMHNGLGITTPVDETVKPFYGRPYLVPYSGRIVDALYKAIRSSEVLAFPRHIGSVDQFVDSTDVLNSLEHCDKLKTLYGSSA